jgi:hypothetical protein
MAGIVAYSFQDTATDGRNKKAASMGGLNG